MSFGGQQPSYDPSGPRYGQPPQPVYAPAAHSAFASAFDRPTSYAPQAPAAPAASAMPPLPVPARKGRSAAIWVFAILGVVLLGLIAYFTFALGTAASLIGFVLALIPLTIVLIGVRLIDRWEPEPKSLVLFALGWGAIAAIGIALLVDLLLLFAVGERSDLVSRVIQAPIVEELAKGLGLVLVFVLGRRTFDGPVDGVVYGALVGAGFAFTENVQYLGVALIEGGAGHATALLFLRGILSPFAHVMFTALTGFAMGLAARRGSSTARVIGSGAIGLIGAIALHAYWNGSAGVNFLLLYITTQVPLFVGFIIAIVLLRREEARLTQQRLGDYAAAGWFTPEEVVMLATPAGRRSALRWARGLRGDRRGVMRSFIKDATVLATVRQRALTGRDPLAAADEHALLLRTRDARAQLLAY